MNNKATSLVEIIVSMLVLAVGALAVVATIALVNEPRQARSAGGSSLDLQAKSYARETLEQLKNAVSTDSTRAAPLNGSVGGTLHDSTTDPALTSLPAGDLLNHGGTRT